jgi:Inhibitor of Apoptosis domain
VSYDNIISRFEVVGAGCELAAGKTKMTGMDLAPVVTVHEKLGVVVIPSITTFMMALSEESTPFRYYRLHENRLKSFKDESCLSHVRQKAEQLAYYEFYYTGKGDQVSCIRCLNVIENWTSDDNPVSLHVVKFGKECALIHCFIKRRNEELSIKK